MSIPFMTHLNIYADSSVGTLNITEQGLYFRLILLKIRIGWQVEWLGATNQRLCSDLNITEKTLINARNKLKQKGFIDFIPGKKGVPTKYRIISLVKGKSCNNSSKNVNKDCNNSSKNKNTGVFTGEYTGECTGNFPDIYKTKTKDYKKAAAAAENANENSNAPKLAEAVSDETDSLTLAEDKAPKDEFAATVKVFEENFHAVGKTEKQELHALFLRYGATWLTEAIKETALSGGRSVRYIKAILERWQKDGFKSKTKGGSMRGITVQSPSQDGIDDFGEAELRQRRNRPWDLQPKPGGGEGV